MYILEPLVKHDRFKENDYDPEWILSMFEKDLTTSGESEFFAFPDDFVGSLSRGVFYIQRNHVEGNSEFRQIIPYIVLLADGQAALVRRNSNSDERIEGMLTIGQGGHINLSDFVRSEDGSQPDLSATITKCVARELAEEFSLEFKEVVKDIVNMGIVKSDRDDISKDHLGILSVVIIDKNNISDIEMEEGKELLGFYDLSKLEERIRDSDDEWELWTRIVLGS